MHWQRILNNRGGKGSRLHYSRNLAFGKLTNLRIWHYKCFNLSFSTSRSFHFVSLAHYLLSTIISWVLLAPSLLEVFCVSLRILTCLENFQQVYTNYVIHIPLNMANANVWNLYLLHAITCILPRWHVAAFWDHILHIFQFQSRTDIFTCPVLFCDFSILWSSPPIFVHIHVAN